MRDWLAPFRGRDIGDEWLRVSGVYIGIVGDAAFAKLAHTALPTQRAERA